MLLGSSTIISYPSVTEVKDNAWMGDQIFHLISTEFVVCQICVRRPVILARQVGIFNTPCSVDEVFRMFTL